MMNRKNVFFMIHFPQRCINFSIVYNSFMWLRSLYETFFLDELLNKLYILLSNTRIQGISNNYGEAFLGE